MGNSRRSNSGRVVHSYDSAFLLVYVMLCWLTSDRA
jgi:hypothetical protein